MTDDALRDEVRKEANRILIDAEYTGRQHMAVGRYWRAWSTKLGLPVAILSAASSGGAGLSALVGGATWVTVLLGFVGAILAAVKIFFRPEDQAASHAAKGAGMLAIRNEARRMMNVDVRSTTSTDALTERVRVLGSRYDTLRAQEPQHLPAWSYDQVKREMEAGNYDYENDRLWEGGK